MTDDAPGDKAASDGEGDKDLRCTEFSATEMNPEPILELEIPNTSSTSISLRDTGCEAMPEVSREASEN